MAVGRDWAAWEVASAELLPAPDADLADDPLVLLEAVAFRSLLSEIEAFWRAPLLEAVLLALTTPSSLYKHCVRGDVFYLELLYRAYLHRHHRTRVRFHNATAAIEAVLPAAARPRGYHYRGSGSAALPSGVNTDRWYHPGPSGLSRLWLHVGGDGDGGDALRALYAPSWGAPSPSSAGRLDSPVGRGHVAFRHDFSSANASHACAVVAALLRLPAAAAALQLSSGVPAQLLTTQCSDVLPRGHAQLLHAFAAGGAVPPPSYWRHRSEWGPDFR